MPVNDTSILNDVKSALGLAEDYTAFDKDVILHLNAVLGTVTQLGVGPRTGFEVVGTNEKWSDLLGEELRLNMVKAYVYDGVKSLFDPALFGFVLTATKERMLENSSRITMVVDEIKADAAAITP